MAWIRFSEGEDKLSQVEVLWCQEQRTAWVQFLKGEDMPCQAKPCQDLVDSIPRGWRFNEFHGLILNLKWRRQDFLCNTVNTFLLRVHGTPRCAGETQSLCKIDKLCDIGFGKSTYKPNQAELVGMCDKTWLFFIIIAIYTCCTVYSVYFGWNSQRILKSKFRPSIYW